MSTIQKVSDAIVQQGMLPLYFNADENVTIEVLRAIYRAGIKAVEYTSRGETALSNFTKMLDYISHLEILNFCYFLVKNSLFYIYFY